MKLFTKILALAAAFCFSATVRAQVEPESISPESGLITNGQTITITYAGYIDWNMPASRSGIAFEPLNGEATDPIYAASYNGIDVVMKTLKITLQIPAGYDDVTEWALVVPADQVVSIMNNQGNAPIRVEYKAEGGDEPVEPVQFLPTAISPNPEQTVELPFNRIHLTFPEEVGEFEANPINFETFDFNVSFTDAAGRNVPGMQFFTFGNEIVFDTFNITDAGIYTLVLKPGFLTSQRFGDNPEIVITFYVGVPTAISAAEQSATAAYYDLQGRPLAAPAPGQTVVRVTGTTAVKVRF